VHDQQTRRGRAAAELANGPGESNPDADSHSGTPAPCDQDRNWAAGAVAAGGDNRAILHDVQARRRRPKKVSGLSDQETEILGAGESASGFGPSCAPLKIFGAPSR